MTLPPAPPWGERTLGRGGDQAVLQFQSLVPCGTNCPSSFGLENRVVPKSTDPYGTSCIVVVYANGAKRSARVPGGLH